MARPTKLTPEIQQRIGDKLLWDLHTLWLPNLLESPIKHLMNG